jgi:apyrase
MQKLCAIFLFFISFSAHASAPHYAIIVDAGSSGSRLHLFQYDDSKPLPVINDIFSENITPGLSSFANQAASAGESLKKLFDDAADQLKAQQIDQATVSVDILASAGMRLLTPETQQAIYNNINDYLKKHYTFTIHAIETIPGKMEGIYGWLDVNYLAKRFESDTDKTMGIIDMGGASTEIAFATTDTSKSDDEMTLKVAGKSYLVYSKSFLGAGQDKAREAMNTGADSASCYPVSYTYSGNNTGHFNYQSCFLNYSPVVGTFFQQNDLPDLANHEFVAYSGIYYAFHFLEVDQTPAAATVINRIQTVCNKTWGQLKQAYPTVAEKYLSAYCANSVYQSNLLFNNFRIQDKQLQVQDKINQKNIDWTLGALLYELL